jgi:hypothetical protein
MHMVLQPNLCLRCPECLSAAARSLMHTQDHGYCRAIIWMLPVTHAVQATGSAQWQT